MGHQGPFSKREEHIVQFNYELALSGISAVAMQAFEEVYKEIECLPWWAIKRRHDLLIEANAMVRLAAMALKYEMDQHKAAKADPTWA